MPMLSVYRLLTQQYLKYFYVFFHLDNFQMTTSYLNILSISYLIPS